MKVSRYKGHPIIELENGNHWNANRKPLSFGLNKAVLILTNIREVRDFVELYGDTEQIEAVKGYIV